MNPEDLFIPYHNEYIQRNKNIPIDLIYLISLDISILSSDAALMRYFDQCSLKFQHEMRNKISFSEGTKLRYSCAGAFGFVTKPQSHNTK